MNPPFGLRPWVGGFWGADTGEQILLPEEPFSIAAPLTHLTRDMVAFHPNGIGLGGRIVVVRGGAHKVGKGQVGLSVTETVVQEGNILSVQGARAPQPVQHVLADLPIGSIGAQGQDSQRCRLKGGVKGCLRECFRWMWPPS